ncbi:MAG: isoprenylcysteine carboxylmethyltransferase family protein [Shimia sp.]|uniref:methyltransferase family protein n=1 Tax=Shimia sp. TaxID=1954381 RepID=UPI0025DEFF84|nr:isoprenylcysteine carboxylmethyltransferase family protein [Shimia sp.]MCH2066202.1 isoprenylcysteine carboxylmethyltransferase family protein [Shimia sp.]
MKPLKVIDLPPVWLLVFLALAWAQPTRWPLGLSFGPVWADLLGGLLVGGGVLLAVLAWVEMQRHQTTIHPHQDSARLVQSGIYSRSRNPIYLADVMILAGFILYWDAVLALPLVPVFLWILERRFVIPEENRLRKTFRVDFARYCEKVRRWV